MPTLTAEQRRASARDSYNANLAGCPGHELLAVLSDKWVTLVVAALADRPLRNSELAAIVAGATQKMLTQTLRRLERNGLVSRTVSNTVPVRVDYALTDLGETLIPLQAGLKTWAETHIDDIRKARSQYDQRAQ